MMKIWMCSVIGGEENLFPLKNPILLSAFSNWEWNSSLHISDYEVTTKFIRIKLVWHVKRLFWHLSFNKNSISIIFSSFHSRLHTPENSCNRYHAVKLIFNLLSIHSKFKEHQWTELIHSSKFLIEYLHKNRSFVFFHYNSLNKWWKKIPFWINWELLINTLEFFSVS